MFLTSTFVFAEDIVKIEIGKRGSSSQRDLERRVLRLEQAVWQLQQRVFNLESSGSLSKPGAEWICKITAMGDIYTGIGGSKAVATHRAIQSCTKARDGNGFFCKDATCEK